MTTNLNIFVRRKTALLMLFLVFLLNSLSTQAQTFTTSFWENGDECDWNFSSMAKNSAGEIYGIWRDGTYSSNNYQYKLLKWNVAGNTWNSAGSFDMTQLQAQTVFDYPSDMVCLAIDASGGYHVVFGATEFTGGCCSQKRGFVYGTSSNGTTWTFITLQELTHPGGFKNVRDPNLKLDANNRPHVVYQYSDATDPREYAIEHRWFNGTSWQFESIVNQAGNANNEVNDPSFDIAPNGDLHVACTRETNGQGLDGSLWHYVKTVGGSWVGTERLHGSGTTAATVHNSIKVLPNGFVSIINNGGSNITELTNASGSWTNLPIGSGIDGGFNKETYSVNANGDKFFAYSPSSNYSSYKYAIKKIGDANWTMNGNIYSGVDVDIPGFSSATMTDSRLIVVLFNYHPNGNCGAGSPRQLWTSYAPGVATTAITDHPDPVTICAGSNAAFSVTATNATGYQWQVNTGSAFTNITNGGVYSNATTATLNITGATAGMNGYQYRCVVSGTPTVNSNPATLTVNSLSVAPTGITGNNTICAGSSTTLTISGGSAGTGATIQWFTGSCGGTAAGTGSSINVSPAATTTYYVRYSGTCNTTTCASITVTVQTLSVAPTGINGTTTVCNGNSTTLTLTGGTAGTGAVANWYSGSCGGTLVGTGNSISVSPTATTTYFVRYIGSCNTTSCASATVTVQTLSTAPTSILGNSSICSGASTTLTISGGSAGTGATIQWFTGSCGGTAAGTGSSINVSPAATTTYFVRYSGTCNTTTCASLTVNVAASITGTSALTPVSCNGGSNGAIDITPTGGIPGYTYSWNVGATTQDLTGLAAGTYTVTITDALGCTGTVSATVVQPTLLTANTTVSPVSCNGGSNGVIDLTPGGGISPYTYMWSTGSTNQDLSGLSAGIYTVTVTDQNGCTRVASGTVLQPGAPLSGSTFVTDVSCNGGSNGTVDLTPAGGTTPYTYNWGGGITTQDRTGLSIGTYTVTITDFNGCTAITSATINQPATSVSGSTTGTNVSCFGGTNGAIDLTPAGGTPGYTYNWGGGITTQDRTGLTAGTYTVTITDANGCTSVVSATVTQPSAQLTGTRVVTDASCNGGSDGAIDVTVTGGTTAYTYLWYNGITTQDLTGLMAGFYTVTITDFNGCTTTVSSSVSQPPLLTGTTTVTNVSCFGGSNGSINLTPAGGTPGYTYLWSNGATVQDPSGLMAGTYTVTITDANACTRVVSATVTQSPASVSGTTTVTSVSCFGGANGSINLTPAGGTPGYTYLWSNGSTVQDPSGLAAGIYTVTITDANGCNATVSATVTMPAEGLSVIPSQTNVLCNGACNGTATVTVTGGTPGYTYLWSPSGGTAATASGLCAGTYTCLITDANGCITTQSFTITQPAVLSSTALQINVLCNGGNTGSATVFPAGGTANYTYLWSPGGGTSATATGLSAGTYTCLITDANGCAHTQSVTITEPPALTSSIISQTNVTCHSGSDGMVTIAPSGGIPNYTYLWSPSGGTAATASGLTAGTYSCLVTDANGCSVTQTVVITQPDPVVVGATATPNPICNAGTLTLGVTASVTYSWTGPNSFTSNIQNPVITNVSALNAGTYNVSITDAAGCLNIGSVNVVVNPTPDVVATPSSQTICSAASITTMVMTGSVTGTTYAWSRNNTASVTGIAASGSGNISGTLTNTTAAPVTVTFIITPTASGCPGPAITATVLVNPTPNAVATPSAQTICSGAGIAPIVLTGNTSGTTYAWTRNNTANVTGIPASGSGNITGSLTNTTSAPITVTFTIIPTANGCTGSSITATVTVNPNAVITISATPNPACIGNILYLSAAGGASYNWIGPAGFASQLQNPARPITSQNQAGNYLVTVTSAQGCISSSSVNVAVNTLPVGTISATPVPSCVGTTVQLNATGGAAYQWSGPLGFTSNIQNPVLNLTSYQQGGEYSVTITNGSGCSIVLKKTVNVLSPPVIKVGYDQTSACAGADLRLFVDGKGSISWTGPGGFSSTLSNPVIQNVTTANAGIYTVVVTGPNGCTATSSFNVTIYPLPVSSATASVYEMCEGATVQLFASGSGMTYKWTGPSGYISTQQNPVISGIPVYMTGKYTVEVKNGSGCASYYTLELKVYSSTFGTISASPNPVCEGGVLHLSSSEGAAYLWLGPNGFTSYDQNPVLYNIGTNASGTYSLIIYSKGGCADSYLFVNVDVKPAAKITARANPNPVNENNKVQLFTSPGQSYVWSGPLNFTSTQQNPVINSVSRYQAGIYTVEVGNENGCTSRALVNLKVLFTNKGNQSLTEGNSGSLPETAIPVKEGEVINKGVVYPNPTNDILNLDVLGSEEVVYSIYNAGGQALILDKITTDHFISTRDLSSGVYQIVYKTKNSASWTISKFVKMN